MSTKRAAQPDEQAVHVPTPRLHEGRVWCPRCGAALRFDGLDLACVSCGYAYDFTPQIQRALRGASWAAVLAAIVVTAAAFAVLSIAAQGALKVGRALHRPRGRGRGE